jgi:hypothetical protein
MRLTTANNLMNEFGLSLGIDGLCLDKDASCQLLIDQQWLVSLMYVPDYLLLNCPVASPDLMQRLPSSVLLEILQENFMAGSDAALAVAPDQRAYLQMRMHLLTANVKSLQAAVEHLLLRSEYWSERLMAVPLKQTPNEQYKALSSHNNTSLDGRDFGLKHRV